MQSWNLRKNNACDDPTSAACGQAHVCKAASTTDPCDAPERCYLSTAPMCFSSKVLSKSNDQRFNMVVSGLPTENGQPIYSAWKTGGTLTGFLSTFDHDAVASHSAISTTNPTTLSGVGTQCNFVSVNRRAQFYWAVSSSVRAHTPPPHGHPASQLTS